MNRHFMELAYIGGPYHGWQTQPNAVSVQETVERGLSTLMRVPVAITGAGRTDAGVNASKMVAHFDLPWCVDDDRHVVLMPVSMPRAAHIIIMPIRIRTRFREAFRGKHPKISISGL